MKLIIAIIQDKDRKKVTDALLEKGFKFTNVASTGGFLREGNATLLIGVTDDSVSAVLGIIRANCRAQTRYVSPWPPAVEGEKLGLLTPIEVQVGGAVVFIADMERLERF